MVSLWRLVIRRLASSFLPLGGHHHCLCGRIAYFSRSQALITIIFALIIQHVAFNPHFLWIYVYWLRLHGRDECWVGFRIRFVIMHAWWFSSYDPFCTLRNQYHYCQRERHYSPHSSIAGHFAKIGGHPCFVCWCHFVLAFIFVVKASLDLLAVRLLTSSPHILSGA